MAPELFNGARVDEAADVYSLGCILYECVARKRPFGELLGDDARSFNMLFKVCVCVWWWCVGHHVQAAPSLPIMVGPKMGLAIVGRTCRDIKSTSLWFWHRLSTARPTLVTTWRCYAHHCNAPAVLPGLLLQIIVAVAINKERPLLPASTPPRLASLISRCWQEEPRQRPRAAAVAAELQDMMQVGLGL
jgi:serine/threonine protein kinase